MAKFRGGDRVVCIRDGSGSQSQIKRGDTGEVMDSGSSAPFVKWDNRYCNTIYSSEYKTHVASINECDLTHEGDLITTASTDNTWTMVSGESILTSNPGVSISSKTIKYPETLEEKLTLKKQSFMNKVSNFAKKLISPELTKLIEAGLIDACSLQLTENGKTRLLEIIFQNEENKKALVAVAEEIIEDSKEK